MLWEPNIVLVVERHVVHVFMRWGGEGGGGQSSELCNQTQISSNVRDGGDEVFLSARQCGPVKSAVNPTSR